MHKRTKRLHQLMLAHQLTPEAVAKLLGRSVTTVRIWRVVATNARVIPADTLFKLETKLASHAAASRST